MRSEPRPGVATVNVWVNRWLNGSPSIVESVCSKTSEGAIVAVTPCFAGLKQSMWGVQRQGCVVKLGFYRIGKARKLSQLEFRRPQT